MYDDLTDPKKRLELVDKYRSHFLKRREGREILTHMFAELGLFEDTINKTERELGRFDYAIRLLEIMSIPNYPNVHNFVKAIAKWPIEYPVKKEEEENV